jgi:hypothetical protein
VVPQYWLSEPAAVAAVMAAVAVVAENFAITRINLFRVYLVSTSGLEQVEVVASVLGVDLVLETEALQP